MGKGRKEDRIGKLFLPKRQETYRGIQRNQRFFVYATVNGSGKKDSLPGGAACTLHHFGML